MADATKLPTISEMVLYQWSRKGAPAPKLAAPIDADDTTLTFTAALKDVAGAVVTAGFPFGIRKSNGWVETCWCPAGGLSADGLTATGVVRGIDPGGIDYTVGDSEFADSHDAREPVLCNIPAFVPELIRSVLQGLIASGGSSIILGTDADGTVTCKRSTGVGTSVGFIRWNTTTDKTEYSNDGAVWVAIDDTVSSVLFKTSSGDTTPGYSEDKLQAGASISITKKNTGANEYLEIDTTLPTVISEHEIFTPAYMTGDTGAETNVSLWDSVSDGSFRITIDGTAYNVDGIDFTAPVISMEEVAATIQAAIRALTGSTETCVWSTNKFIITSVDTSSSSEVTVTSTSTGTVGTDISGAGASDWMDADTGNGTETACVIDITEDSGKLVELGAGGEFLIGIPSGIICPYAGSSAPSGWLLCDGTTGKDSIADPTLAGLYAVIGTTYGGVDAEDFDLPDLRERVPVGLKGGGTFTPLAATGGVEEHTLTESEMPSHSHNVPRGTVNGTNAAMQATDAGTDIASDSVGGGNPHTNLQPYIVLNYIIKI